MTGARGGCGAPASYPPPATAWTVVAVLVLAYTFSFVDRSILTLMVGPIRASLAISDVELSLLHGLAFALFYTFLGIPIARWADRGNRTRIIALGILVWSAMTALCGLSRSFLQMFLARVGVGVGEAALSPAAFSLMADYFPPQKLARALSVYSAAIYLGSGVALIGGGALIAHVAPLELPVIGHLEPWQVVFLWVGLPGLLVVGLMRLVREPARIGTGRGDMPTLGAVLRYLGDRRAAYGLLIAGYGLRGMIWQGASAWIPTFFMRSFHWSTATVGLAWGLVVLVVGGLGNVAGGIAAGRMLEQGRRDANLRVCILSTVALIPFGVAGPLMSTGAAALAVYAVFTFFASAANGPVAASLQEITPNRMRAQVSAIYLFANNLCGIGLGATVVALFTDYLFAGGAGLRYALALTIAVVPALTLVLLALAQAPFRRALAETPAPQLR